MNRQMSDGLKERKKKRYGQNKVISEQRGERFKIRHKCFYSVQHASKRTVYE